MSVFAIDRFVVAAARLSVNEKQRLRRIFLLQRLIERSLLVSSSHAYTHMHTDEREECQKPSSMLIYLASSCEVSV